MALLRGFPLLPDDATDPDIFRIDMSRLGPFSMSVAFGREPGLGVTSANFDLMPISLRKQPAMRNPRRWAAGVLSGLGVAGATLAVRRRSSHARVAMSDIGEVAAAPRCISSVGFPR